MSDRMKPTKEELLTKYEGKKPRFFFEYNALADIGAGDDGHRPDADGDHISWGETYELMYGSHVRVLIPIDVTPEQAVRLLRKLIEIIEQDLTEKRPSLIADEQTAAVIKGTIAKLFENAQLSSAALSELLIEQARETHPATVAAFAIRTTKTIMDNQLKREADDYPF